MNIEIKKLIKEIMPHKKKISIVAITGILYAAAYSRVFLKLKEITDGFENGNSDLVIRNALIVLGLAFVVAISRYFHIFTMNYVCEIVVNELRVKLQNKFMRLNLSFHNTYVSGSGGLLSRILNDVKVIQDGLRMIADLFREPLLATLLLINLFYLNWRLTCFIVLLIPVILVFLRKISKSLRKYVLLGQENLERITSVIKESIDGVRTIQSFNLENEMTNKLKEETNKYIEIRRKVHSRIEIMGPVTEFIATLVILGIFFYFSIQVSKGEITTGAVLAYIASMLSINQPIKKLQESYVRIQETLVASNRIYSLLENDSEVPELKDAVSFPKAWKTITFENIGFKYGDKEVLKNINLTITRGQQVAFVGESGSGKSTILNLLERFFDPTSGYIKIDGIDIQKFSLKELRDNIGLVSQDVFLFSDTIERNIQSGNFAKLEDVTQYAIKAHANDFIEKFPLKYQNRVGDRGSLLSGGEKQRVSMARALYKNADILILDEATSALDSASEVIVQQGLDEMMAGKTVLVVAHRLSTIQNVNIIYVVKNGEIVESGSHQQLIDKRSEYFKFYSIQTS